MNFLNLFKQSRWSKLKKFDDDIQQDVAYLMACDTLIATAVKNSVEIFVDRLFSCDDASYKQLVNALRSRECVQELMLALLGTGIGKGFDTIRWSWIAPDAVVNLVGILAMGQFRNDNNFVIGNDIHKSGYSYQSEEARSQFLTYLANHAIVNSLTIVKSFDVQYFSKFWEDIQLFLFDKLQLNISAEPSGLTAVVRARFENFPANKQNFIIILAENLSNSKSTKKSQYTLPQSSSACVSKLNTQFVPEVYKTKYPYCFLDHSKLTSIIVSCSEFIVCEFKAIGISDYNFIELCGVKGFIPEMIIDYILWYDANVLSYCAMIATVESKEPKFIGCGVWKKVTNDFEQDRTLCLGMMAEFKENISSDLDILSKKDLYNIRNSWLNLVLQIRQSPRKFLSSNGDTIARMKLLLQGTVGFANVLSHPVYGRELLEIIDKVFVKIAHKLGELLKEE